jgi:mono/diheme cytochrome c family protein
MKSVHELAFSVFVSVTVAAGGALATQQSPRKPVSKQALGTQSSTTLKSNEIARGRYLVEEVARCPDCHAPQDSNGAPDHSRWLQGASMWIMPVNSKLPWTLRAPDLAGFSYSDQQAEDILERG